MLDESELRSAVSPELQAGEKLLWVGRPSPMRVLMQRGDDVVGAVVAVAVLAILGAILPIFMIAPGSAGPSDTDFVGIAVLVVLVAVVFAISVPAYRYFVAKRTIYAITNRRVLTIKPTFSGKAVQSQTRFEQIERRERADGSGDLTFGTEIDPLRSRYRPRLRKIGFFGIPDVRRVEQLMLDTFREQTASA